MVNYHILKVTKRHFEQLLEMLSGHSIGGSLALQKLLKPMDIGGERRTTTM